MNVYLSTKHKNKCSNCQPFDLFIVTVQESSDPPVDQPPQSPTSPGPCGKKIVSRKFNGTCIWYKRTFDLFQLLFIYSFIYWFYFHLHLPKDDVRVSFSKWWLLIFRIMCSIGGLGRHIGRYIGRLSTDHRSTIGRQSTDYRSTIGRLSVDRSADSGWIYRPTVDR